MYPKRHTVRFPEGDSAELIEYAEDSFYCPVCGYPGVDLMYPIDDGREREVWDYTICPSCHIEYGADDSLPRSSIEAGFRHVDRWKQLREQWLKAGGFEPASVLQVRNLEAGLDNANGKDA